jgi:hypothetical protein
MKEKYIQFATKYAFRTSELALCKLWQDDKLYKTKLGKNSRERTINFGHGFELNIKHLGKNPKYLRDAENKFDITLSFQGTETKYVNKIQMINDADALYSIDNITSPILKDKEENQAKIDKLLPMFARVFNFKTTAEDFNERQVEKEDFYYDPVNSDLIESGVIIEKERYSFSAENEKYATFDFDLLKNLIIGEKLGALLNIHSKLQQVASWEREIERYKENILGRQKAIQNLINQ